MKQLTHDDIVIIKLIAVLLQAIAIVLFYLKNKEVVFRFHRKILSDSDGGLSSKRYTGTLCVYAAMIITEANLLFKMTVTDNIWFGITGLIVACFGLNAMIDIKKPSDTPKP